MASKTTTDHDEIRKWVEARGGCPAHVKSTGRKGSDPGILRIDYEGFSGVDTLEKLEWDDWFAAFDANKLAFVYDPAKKSRFSKLVARASAPKRAAAKRTTAKRATAKRTTTAKRATKRPAAKARTTPKKRATSTKKRAATSKRRAARA